ncbi:cell division topological specificity factor MinE [Clostridium argentinense CDC 2741]|uniref:Cell division topological specificity factor n=1 Tax=Clostridium argentinense CDC 2741 TaxID=1418104 RepID=A0A0C1U2F5_9CLOT|nr:MULTISPECIES: cell division topological specificity factor MinE [Clostridium]ARC85574.1 cell division topological specificity factor MinE [Clostridium argentinense]KIE47034.1 cell division topological specificity factor MinE [Clostridium argentinense CDC 2741]NFF40089.1 cell division topological specificity factor MinE [Clostridium argentinense]NFP50211.1 cell division topological specificity factor MinE [Clostridium argentinense]NFP74852.1 cell division topological specificity factor MinE 
MDLFKIFSSKLSSKDIATDRLKLILIHDRADFSPDFLEMIKGDLLKVISNYAEIDDSDVDVKFTKAEEIEGASPALIASIPIKKIKNR